MRKILIILAAIALLLSVAARPVVLAGDAMDDLEGMTNTGVTFDGSDGQRSGMDIDVDTDPGDDIPTPEPVEIPS